MLHGEFTFVVLANISLANELQIMVEAWLADHVLTGVGVQCMTVAVKESIQCSICDIHHVLIIETGRVSLITTIKLI
jgi:hypothetical protein